MFQWFKDAFVDLFGYSVPPAFIFAFADLIVNSTLAIAFGRYGGRLKIGGKNG